MRSRDVRLGMLVKERRGLMESGLRDRVGIVRHRFGSHSYSPFEVQFESIEYKPHELLWASELE